MMQAPSLPSSAPWLAVPSGRDKAERTALERRALLMLLALALVLRLGLVWAARGIALEIRDEQHYATLAHNVSNGQGFAWAPGEPTSLRAPLFPFFVASIWRLTGSEGLTAVRLAQIPLSLLSIWLVYLIGRRVFNPRVALFAAAGFAFYPSLLFSGVLLLSETLFVCLLLLTLLGCLMLMERRVAWIAVATGACLGAAALTRSIMWPFIVVLAGAAVVGLNGPLRARLKVAVLLVLGYVVVVGPWSVRNTLLQRSFTVVDTQGGLNLLMGNYEYTPEDRMWDAISLDGDKAWSRDLPSRAPDGSRWTEGTKEKWAQRQALAYMKAHPMTTARRSVLKLADFWGFERDFVAGVQQRLYQPPSWLFLAGALSIAGSYAALLVLGVIGFCLARPVSWRAHVLLLSVVLFMSGIHALVFGHSRYHLPLVPILLVYAAAAIDRRAWRTRWRTVAGASAVVLFVAIGAVWARDLLFRDATRLADLGRFLGLTW